tara:strand:+ start:4953 stop:5123 length:171 start_codon:yes stop_codon:yes gene_type:complete
MKLLLLKKNKFSSIIFGEVAEWLKAHAWKACKGATLSWVRIPFSPPSNNPHFKRVI